MLGFHVSYNSWQYLVLKYQMEKLSRLPKIESLTLHLKLTNSSFSALCVGLLVLEMITYRRPLVIFSKKANLVLKLRKGVPVSCKLTLTGVSLTDFLESFWLSILSRSDVVELVSVKRTESQTASVFTVLLHDLFLFKNLEGFYFDFREFVSGMQIQLVLAGSPVLADTFIQSLKFPLPRF